MRQISGFGGHFQMIHDPLAGTTLRKDRAALVASFKAGIAIADELAAPGR
jgi:hypothetical protein